MSPEPEINITHNTCFMPPCSKRRHFAIRQSEWQMHLPFAYAFATGEWQMVNGEWQMLSSHCRRQSLKLKLPLGKNGVKKVLCVTLIPGFNLPHQQAEACHALPLLLVNNGLGSKIDLNIN